MRTSGVRPEQDPGRAPGFRAHNAPIQASDESQRKRRRSERKWPRLVPDREESKLQALITRLRRRKLAEWMLAYFAIAWMVLQMTDVLREIWDWPVGLQRGITLALAFGVLPAWVVAWYHGEKGRQKVSVPECCVVGALVAGSAWLIWLLCA